MFARYCSLFSRSVSRAPLLSTVKMSICKRPILGVLGRSRDVRFGDKPALNFLKLRN